jgi:trans-aconitate methyltransferase
MTESSTAATTPPTTWDADLYRERHAFVYESSQDLVARWLDPQPGEEVLDLGCGSGELSAQIASHGAMVTGIDASESMVAAARAGWPGAHFEVQDARELPYREHFGAVFSNAALHWMGPLEPVFAGIHAALKPGGRLVLEMGGAGNIQVTLDAVQHATAHLGLPELTHPWTFPSTAELAQLLEGAGLRADHLLWFERPSLLPGEDGFRAWLESFGSGWLFPLTGEERKAVVRAAEEFAHPKLWNGEGWASDYCRLRAKAVRIT